MRNIKSAMAAVCDIAAAYGRPKSIKNDFFRQQQIKYGVAKRQPKFVTISLSQEQRAMKKNIINLTPHLVNIQNVDGTFTSVKPDGTVARVETFNDKLENFGLPFDLFVQKTGTVKGLPAENGNLFLVSAMVRLALPNRMDLASPGDLIRDDKGQPIGCKGLVVNCP